MINAPLKGQQFLFHPSEFPLDDLPVEPAVKQFDRPVCTSNKAQLIMRYLRYFVLITKHGTYIDGFAGPQVGHVCDSWAARLVLDSEPKWMRNFHLCDKKRSQVRLLNELKDAQSPCEYNRTVKIYEGDFNVKIDEILMSGGVTEKEATFALLDQRTFECRWSTVEKIAHFKASGSKIELFYFLANNWLERALAAQKDLDVLTAWWGRDDWTKLRAMSRDQRRDTLVGRFKTEFGYKTVKAWPIYRRLNGGGVMYYMIHAADHPEAYKLMSRAYSKTVTPLEPIEQLKLELQLVPEHALVVWPYAACSFNLCLASVGSAMAAEDPPHGRLSAIRRYR
jgi:three-Cys-motif partner protein